MKMLQILFKSSLLSVFLFFFAYPRILDNNGLVLPAVLEIFRNYAPLIENLSFPSINIKKILSKETDSKDITLAELNTIAQAAFKRPDNVERTFVDSHYETFNKYTNELVFKLFEKIGDIDTVIPSTEKKPRYILINGSTISGMYQRIKTIAKFINAGFLTLEKNTEFVFLTGDRTLYPHEWKEFEFTKNLRVDSLPTNEYQAAQILWNSIELPADIRSHKITFINAPKREVIDPKTEQKNLERPRTIDTVDSWLALSPEPGHCLTISSQPFVYYQEATLAGALKQRDLFKRGFSIEGVGLAMTNKRIGILLDNLARTIYTEVQNQKITQ